MSELLHLLEAAPFSADMCVKCNICTAHCTVAPFTDLFPGPKHVGPQAQRLRDPNAPSVDKSVDYCSGCGICTLVCPHGVKVMEINTQAKAGMVETHGLSLRNWFLGRNEVWGRLGTPFAPVLNWAMGNRPLRLAAEKTLKISARGPMPKWAGYTFRGWWQQRQRRLRQAGHPPSRFTIRRARWSTSTAARPTATSRTSAARRWRSWSTWASR